MNIENTGLDEKRVDEGRQIFRKYALAFSLRKSVKKLRISRVNIRVISGDVKAKHRRIEKDVQKVVVGNVFIVKYATKKFFSQNITSQNKKTVTTVREYRPLSTKNCLKIF